MKLLTAFVAAALGLSFGANAFAQSASSGLTRAEVVAQLAQAQAEGYVPTSENNYPPTDAAIARNREIYAIQHGIDGHGAVKTAGSAVVHTESVSN
ncbi:DUF4148 domain-containing protein [Paraburkholderia sp. SIMBA_030]|uniref:DUF4148 domain-containing protein n=1 Tax=Paraburkholderia sp. SIMBA_030 TaxID=3085773 RepID=UPI0039797B53